MAKLILLDETEKVLNHQGGVTKQTKTYKLGDEKFQIRYENSNGSPCGFNSKMCLRQYSKEKAQWNNLEDISVLKMPFPKPSYYSSESTRYMEEFFKLMEKRLTKIYG